MFLKQLFLIIILLSKGLDEQGAEKACREFGIGWSVSVVRDGSLVCTRSPYTWVNNCHTWETWRLVVWKDGAHEFDAGGSRYDGIPVSSKSGKYYGGHEPCEIADNFPLRGQWGHILGKFKPILLLRNISSYNYSFFLIRICFSILFS